MLVCTCTALRIYAVLVTLYTIQGTGAAVTASLPCNFFQPLHRFQVLLSAAVSLMAEALAIYCNLEPLLSVILQYTQPWDRYPGPKTAMSNATSGEMQ